MSVLTGFFLYFLIWWIVLFIMLPIGIKPAEDDLAGSMPGAPSNPNLFKKALWTTLFSFVVWAVVYIFIQSDLISFREMAAQIPM